jgi:tripartite-type tricarboxylate transporter receptor subunit TctC
VGLPAVYIRLTACALACASASGASAQEYPTRAIRFIIPTSPGGASDVLGRLLAQRMTDTFGQQVIADNRAGASNTIGVNIIAKAPPDGYTVGISAASLAVNPSIIRKMPYDTLTEIAPVSRIAEGPFMILLHPSVPAKTVKELIALAKTRPDALAIASSGIGTTPHLAGELFNTLAGVKILQVVYKGTGQALTSLLSGEISTTYASPVAVSHFVKTGKLRALAVTSKARSKAYPEVPAIAETLPAYEALQWFGVMTTAGTPRPVIDKLSQTIARILRTPEMSNRLTNEGMEVVASTPDEFAATLRQEMTKWAKVIRDAGIKTE